MLLSEMIAMLQAKQREYGDIEVVVMTQPYGKGWHYFKNVGVSHDQQNRLLDYRECVLIHNVHLPVENADNQM